MPNTPFGNDVTKLARYRRFWECAATDRPLVGFTLRGWFPLNEYATTRSWPSNGFLTPEMVEPTSFLDDEVAMLREGEVMQDDIIRGSAPAAAVIPWLAAMLGAQLRILPGNVLGEATTLDWDRLSSMRLNPASPWYAKYMEVCQALVQRAQGRFPISHGALVGPSDLLGQFRGHTQAILDLLVEPKRAETALWQFAEIFQQITEQLWQQLPLFHRGYYDGMYQLWAPGPIARMQEDASAVYSPELYRRFLLPIDRHLAQRFSHAFIHLHSTSMFLLDAMLEIEELGCVEINNDASGPPLEEMLPHFMRVQAARRALLIRGSFTQDEVRLLMDSLDPRGLFLLILVQSVEETDRLRPLLGMSERQELHT